MYIDNSNTATPLIWGNFTSNDVIINGDLSCISLTETSDIRFKRDINNLSGALNQVLKLNGISYYWRTDEFKDWGFDNSKQVGFIAQDVEKILPELVKENDKGYKSIDYTKMTPVLVEAIKEQQNEIEFLRKKVNALENENA